MSSSKIVDFESVKERVKEEGANNGRQDERIMAQQQQQRQLHGVGIPRHLKRRRVQGNWFRQKSDRNCEGEKSGRGDIVKKMGQG